MAPKEQHVLSYDKNKWVEKQTKPENTLQIFITDRCDMRCKGCFYAHGLGKTQMSVEKYRDTVEQYKHAVSKVTLLGGEPTLHPQLCELVQINRELGLKTTVYTNGHFLDKLSGFNGLSVDLRIGVYGNLISEKPLSRVKDTELPVKIVYMLRKDNIHELRDACAEAVDRFDCKSFYVSSIRDITVTGDYWLDTGDTVSPDEYASVVQRFVSDCDCDINRLDIATRGVLRTETQDFSCVNTCRFGNVFTNGDKITCPFDISRKKLTSELKFGLNECNKHTSCLLQKIVLERKK